MKMFKTNRHHNNFIIYFGMFLISISFSIWYLYTNNLINDDTLIDYLIGDDLYQYKEDITDAKFLLKYVLNVDLKEKEEKKEVIPVIKQDNIKTIYIYNTHPEEKYQITNMESYNVRATVTLASKILKEYLEEYGYGVVVEEDSVAEKLRALNWKYGNSYKVSRMFIESAKDNNKSLEYFIDIHRDAGKYESTTTNIDGDYYARLLFVVGLDNESYEPNLKLAEDLSNRLNGYNKTLCRGIMKKSGSKVNGVYNQDFSDKVMLLEVGGQYNNIREVNNSLRVFAKVLDEYIKENSYE